MEVSSIQSAGMSPEPLSGSTSQDQGPSFTKVLERAVEAVNQDQHEADTAARDFGIGDAQSLHDTMIAMEKADITLRLLTQVRNRAVEAYQEVMRMQI